MSVLILALWHTLTINRAYPSVRNPEISTEILLAAYHVAETVWLSNGMVAQVFAYHERK